MATVPLGLYLWTRIHQLGISHIFGVPGDFNLTLLDHIYNVQGLEWVGNTNELNAAYAADGYARVKQGAGCVVTTHGVGELSAINGIAGAMTEQIKVIHVVGQTSRTMQEKHMMIHHSIGFSPDHQIFNHASRGFRVAAAELQSEVGAAEEIDRVLRECFIKSGPVYIYVPIDIVDLPVPADRLKTPIDLEPEFDVSVVKQATEAILEVLYNSKQPAILVDCLTQRHGAAKEARELVKKLNLPVYTSNTGKGIIDETDQDYVGIYNGVISGPGVQSAFEACDNVLVLGNLPCDTNAAGFTRKIDPDQGVFVNPTDVDVQGKKTFTAPIRQVLKHLAEVVEPGKLQRKDKVQLPERPLEEDHASELITQSWIWLYLSENFFRPNDVILGETGTAAYGIPDVTFPPNVQWITQTYYMSIGYCTAASFGADMALKESARLKGHPRGRTVVCTGEGSLMLTVQEIASMTKQNLCPVFIIINNAGYTIERIIHGARQTYNDVPPFNYQHMLSFFNMPEEQAKKSFHRCMTKAELEDALKSDSVQNPKSVQVIEVVMDTFDVPWRLSSAIATRGPEVIREMREAGFKVRDLAKDGSFWV